jgi:hypothetical protein
VFKSHITRPPALQGCTSCIPGEKDSAGTTAGFKKLHAQVCAVCPAMKQQWKHQQTPAEIPQRIFNA